MHFKTIAIVVVTHTYLFANNRTYIAISASVYHTIFNSTTKWHIVSTHGKFTTAIGILHSHTVVVNLIFTTNKLAYREHSFATFGKIWKRIFYVVQEILLCPFWIVFNSIPTETIYSGLLFKPHNPLACLVAHIVFFLHWIVSFYVGTLSVSSFIKTVVWTPVSCCPIVIIFFVCFIRMEVLPVFGPTTFSIPIITLTSIYIRSFVTNITEVFPFIVPSIWVFATSTAVFATSTYSMIYHSIGNYLYTIGVHHGNHSKYIIFGTKTSGHATFLVFIAQIIKVEWRISH